MVGKGMNYRSKQLQRHTYVQQWPHRLHCAVESQPSEFVQYTQGHLTAQYISQNVILSVRESGLAYHLNVHSPHDTVFTNVDKTVHSPVLVRSELERPLNGSEHWLLLGDSNRVPSPHMTANNQHNSNVWGSKAPLVLLGPVLMRSTYGQAKHSYTRYKNK